MKKKLTNKLLNLEKEIPKTSHAAKQKSVKIANYKFFAKNKQN